MAIDEVLAKYSEFINLITQGRVDDYVVSVLWKRQSFNGLLRFWGVFVVVVFYFMGGGRLSCNIVLLHRGYESHAVQLFLLSYCPVTSLSVRLGGGAVSFRN